MEPGLVPSVPAPITEAVSAGVDARGGVTVFLAVVVIGLCSLRSPPTPSEPLRVPVALSEPWMADALPGVGGKTRDAVWRRLQHERPADLPERARVVAGQLFTWPGQPPR